MAVVVYSAISCEVNQKELHDKTEVNEQTLFESEQPGASYLVQKNIKNQSTRKKKLFVKYRKGDDEFVCKRARILENYIEDTDNDSMTLESIYRHAELVSRENKALFNKKVDMHMHNHSIIIVYGVERFDGINFDLKYSINQMVINILLDYCQMYFYSLFYIAKFNNIPTKENHDINIFLLDTFRTLYKLYISTNTDERSCAIKFEKSCELSFRQSSKKFLAKVYKYFEANDKMLIIDNICSDVNDFELVYSVLLRSESFNNHFDQKNVIILNLRHQDECKKNVFFELVYKRANEHTTPIKYYNELKIELLDYKFLKEIQKYDCQNIVLGKRIHFVLDGQNFIYDIVKKNISAIEGGFMFMNLAVYTPFANLSLYSAVKFFITNNVNVVFNTELMFPLVIHTHSKYLCYIFNVKLIKNNKLFMTREDINYYLVLINVEIRLELLGKYDFSFFYYISAKKNNISYVSAINKHFTNNEAITLYKKNQKKAKIIFEGLKKNLQMNFLTYNDFWNSSNTEYLDLLDLMFIRRPWSQVIEIENFIGKFNFFDKFEELLKQFYGAKFDVKYFFGNCDFKKLRSFDITEMNNHF
ncbi:hypothetical protein COBT_000129 [Conglomerata obtusa]